MINPVLLQQALEYARSLEGRPERGFPFAAAAHYAHLVHPHTPSMGNPYPREHIQAEREALAFLQASQAAPVMVERRVESPRKVKPIRASNQVGLFEVAQ